MSDFCPNNQVNLLRNGTEFFPALISAIDAAQREVHLQTYIYEADEVGISVAEALKRAANRGVSVCVLLDGFGCKDLSGTLVADLYKAGVSVVYYRPRISPWSLKPYRLRRLHRKVTVVDGRLAFVGGINIIDDMNTPGHTPPRVDYAVSVEGPLVQAIHANVRALWQHSAWMSLRRARPVRFKTVELPEDGSVWAAFVIRDNVLHRHDIEDAYLFAIESAREEIVVANAYFLPGTRLRKALEGAARRGVRVVLLLQARVEYWLLDYASRALYRSFLEAGIEIHEYQTSFMHSKVAVIDRRWSTVGSSNIDPMSLLLANEANIIVDDTAFSALLRDDLEMAITRDSTQLKPSDWGKASWLRRTGARLTYTLIRLMMGVVGVPDKA